MVTGEQCAGGKALNQPRVMVELHYKAASLCSASDVNLFIENSIDSGHQ
jgi:hypothetical protein